MLLDPTEPPPPPALFATEAPSADLYRRSRVAYALPDLVLRFTARSGPPNDYLLYESRADAWQWPVPAGFTIELRAVWGLGASSSAAIRPIAMEEP